MQNRGYVEVDMVVVKEVDDFVIFRIVILSKLYQRLSDLI